MRVLLLTDWMTEAGGAEEYMQSVRRALARAGDAVHLLACGARTPPERTVDTFVRGADTLVAQSVLQIVNPPATRAVRREVQSFRPDVVLAGPFLYHLSPSALTGIEGVPIVVTVMDYKLICPLGTRMLPDGTPCGAHAGAVCWRGGCLSLPHWLRDQVRYARVGAAMSRVSAIVVPSVAVRDEFLRNGIESHVIPIPVRFPTDEPVRRRATAPRFLYCGRLSPEKGIDVLLRAFARVREAHPVATLHVVGDGGEHRALAQLSASLGLGDAVQFRGRLAFTDVERELEEAWALVAPSRWAEPFGLVAPEAIVRHVPVIATQPGGLAETVEEGLTGHLVPRGDTPALAAAMESIAGGRTFGNAMLPDEAVRRLRHHVAESRCAEALHLLFASVVERSVA